jgi:hypothetical protein
MNEIVECPHCSSIIIIEQLNCKIFRHGIYKKNYKQIDPHMNKEKCDDLIMKNEIYGCGKPFKIIIDDNIYKAIKCDYI